MRWFGFGFGAEAPPAAAPFTGRSFCRSGLAANNPAPEPNSSPNHSGLKPLLRFLLQSFRIFLPICVGAALAANNPASEPNPSPNHSGLKPLLRLHDSLPQKTKLLSAAHGPNPAAVAAVVAAGIAIVEAHVPRAVRIVGIRRGRPEIRRRRVREIIRIDAGVIAPAINNTQQLFATRQAPVAESC